MIWPVKNKPRGLMQAHCNWLRFLLRVPAPSAAAGYRRCKSLTVAVGHVGREMYMSS